MPVAAISITSLRRWVSGAPDAVTRLSRSSTRWAMPRRRSSAPLCWLTKRDCSPSTTLWSSLTGPRQSWRGEQAQLVEVTGCRVEIGQVILLTERGVHVQHAGLEVWVTACPQSMVFRSSDSPESMLNVGMVRRSVWGFSWPVASSTR